MPVYPLFYQNQEHTDSTERVAAFVEGTASYVGLHKQISRDSQSSAISRPPAKRFEFKVEPEDREFLMSVFLIARNRTKGHGFPLL